jgi:PhzF family phenazine biosynthesis protein
MSAPERRLPFQQVDVFTAVPFKGNPVAVVLDGAGLSTQRMQAIAAWTNLSETTFVCAASDPDADYRLRIFTPRAELPFAGHPTIGSAHAVLRHGRVPRRQGRLVQECGKGLVEIRIEGERLFLGLPVPAFTAPAPEERAAAAAALGVPAGDVLHAAIVDVGAVWFTVQLRDAAQVAKLAPDMGAVAALSHAPITGLNVFGFHADGASPASGGAPAADVEVRSFAPAQGIPEDPVCGSGNGCVAALIRRERLLAADRYVATQGRCLGRDGAVEVRFEDGAIWLGGHAVTCVEGTLTA